MTSAPAAELVEQLAAWLADTDIELLELLTPEGTIRLHRDDRGVTGGGTGPSAPCASTVAAAPPLAITAASVGVFLHRHPLHDVPLACPGQVVRAGVPVGLLRIGALLLPVPAPRDGVILDVPAADGSTVGYGTVLARLRPR